jgi:hypothetical protein
MTQPTAFSTFDLAESTLGVKPVPALSIHLASRIFLKAHPDLSFTIEGGPVDAASAVLQILAEIDDSTFCHIAAIVAEHSKTVTDPTEFNRIHKCLAATNALACVIAGMGSN